MNAMIRVLAARAVTLDIILMEIHALNVTPNVINALVLQILSAIPVKAMQCFQDKPAVIHVQLKLSPILTFTSVKVISFHNIMTFKNLVMSYMISMNFLLLAGQPPG